MASKIEVEVDVNSDAGKFWDGIKKSTTLFPKAFPDQCQSVEVLEGDGKSVGTVRLIKYTPGLLPISTTTEKFESVDDGKKTLSYSVIDGDIIKYYKNFKARLSVSPKGKTGSSVKWSCEFDKANENVPNPDFLKDFAVKHFNGLDVYLHDI